MSKDWSRYKTRDKEERKLAVLSVTVLKRSDL